MLDRRRLIRTLGATSLAALWPPRSHAATIGLVCVVGGGMAGATAAKYLRMWSGNAVAVTLVEQERRYTSNIMSNLMVTGQVSMSSLCFGYDTLVRKYGIRRLTARVEAIEPGGALGTWKVTLSSCGVRSHE